MWVSGAGCLGRDNWCWLTSNVGAVADGRRRRSCMKQKPAERVQEAEGTGAVAAEVSPHLEIEH